MSYILGCFDNVPMSYILECFDGTWQGAKNGTVIHALSRAFPACIYNEGVGTRFPYLLGGAFGVGVKRNVCEMYFKLCVAHRIASKGGAVKVILAGYSRGATEARMCAGLVAAHGYKARSLRHAEELFDLWRNDRKTDSGTNTLVDLIIAIDTVGALGVPAGGGRWLFAPKFKNCTLSPRVANGLHVLALDEEREAFDKTLWQPRAGILQVAIPGDHGDVGNSQFVLDCCKEAVLATIQGRYDQKLIADLLRTNPPPYEPKRAGWLTALPGKSRRTWPENVLLPHP
jgi:hypothetical protein